MKKIGVIGGLGWLSTIDYYRLLCSKANEYYAAHGCNPPLPTPPIVIESLDMSKTRMLRGVEGEEASWVNFEAVFRQAFERLRGAGADFGIIASNTPHMRINGILRGLDFRVLSILDTTAAAARSLNCKRVLVLGTTVTMNSPVYAQALARFDLEIVPKLPEYQINELGRMIDEDLYQGRIGRSRERILELSESHANGTDDLVCLGCTELSLAFPEHRDEVFFEDQGITFLNTTVAHVQAALDESLGG